jgi:pyruvate/2-oxoglutarate dehydrogenase complex dihydrolipoamide dehydrogenase (E3) component
MNNVEVEKFRQADCRQRRSRRYDLVILGSGTGSKFLAWTFAEQGQSVATIERKYLGGSCPNIACLPGKNIIHFIARRSRRTFAETGSSASRRTPSA